MKKDFDKSTARKIFGSTTDLKVRMKASTEIVLEQLESMCKFLKGAIDNGGYSASLDNIASAFTEIARYAGHAEMYIRTIGIYAKKQAERFEAMQRV